MDYQKDNKKTEIMDYTQKPYGGAISNSKSLINNDSYEYANKKTERIVTALYMVTDCMDADDALKSKLRFLGVELLSDMYKFVNILPLDRKNHLTLTLSHVNEILSLIEISYTIGFISEMNTAILKRELQTLTNDLKFDDSSDKHFTFTLDQEMFNIPKPQPTIKDKKPNTYLMSFKKDKISQLPEVKKNSQISTANNLNKEERSEKILSLIKDKKEVSIKDISTAFIDCSEKTIQRELNNLVSKGSIKKIGEKRWSRYQAI